MSKVKLALIGCGGISKTHVSRFDKSLDRLDVVGAVDTRIEKACRDHPCKAATNYRAVLDDVDAVLLRYRTTCTGIR